VLRVLVLVLVLLTSHALWSLQLERRMQRGDNRGRVCERERGVYVMLTSTGKVWVL
jgi:hypothetical protein